MGITSLRGVFAITISTMKLYLFVLSAISINGALGCPITGGLPIARRVKENIIERLGKAQLELDLTENRDTFWDDYMNSLKEIWEVTGEIYNTVPPAPEVRAFMAKLVMGLDNAIPELDLVENNGQGPP